MEAEAEDIPYIHSPDEMDDTEDGLQCFIHPDRICGPDCMSFTTQPAESPTLNEQQKHCVLLVGLERIGRYSGGIVRIIKGFIDDKARAAQSINTNTPG